METEIRLGHISHKECTARLNAVGDALYVIGGKWKLRIITTLSSGTKRFNELQRAIDGISAKMLSNELKDLEINGFVKRTVHEGPPVVVEYEPTSYSDSLHDVLESLNKWGTMHREKLRSESR